MASRGVRTDKYRWPYRVDLLPPGGLTPHIREHLEWMRTKNYSEGTVAHRQLALCQLAHWLVEREIVHPGEVTQLVLERYRRWLFHYRKRNGEPMAFSAQHHRLSVVKLFFAWLAKQSRIPYNPALELELPRLEKRLPKSMLTPQEAELVLRRPDTSTRAGLRDRAILETFYSTGMRRMELAGLRVWDLDENRGTVMIRQGKGKKDRVVPIGERAIAWVHKYLDEARPSLVAEADEGTLFLNRFGRAVTPAWLSKTVRVYVKEAGLSKEGSCHMFRHTTATLMLEGGADIRYIQQMLGHTDLTSTQIYTQVSIAKLKEVHERTHPGASLGHPDRGRIR